MEFKRRSTVNEYDCPFLKTRLAKIFKDSDMDPPGPGPSENTIIRSFVGHQINQKLAYLYIIDYTLYVDSQCYIRFSFHKNKIKFLFCDDYYINYI